MNPFEYLLSFASVILALAISDLAVSLNRLLAAGARTRWDWLAPLAAIVAFLKIVTQWWVWFGAAPIARAITFGMFVGVLLSTVLLFLLAASALPDEAGREGVDLRAYYAGNSRRFWLLFALHWLLVNITTIWILADAGSATFQLAASPLYLIGPVAILLAATKSRALHTIGLVGFCLLYGANSFRHVLGQ